MRWRKILIILAILIFGWLVILRLDFSRPEPQIIGATFSQPYAEWLGLNWREIYLNILDGLKVRDLRLIASWSEIEKQSSQYDFTDLDWQINEAAKRGARVLLVIGRRAPRWPECHIPSWAANLNEAEQQARVLKFLEAAVNHFKPFANIYMWQVDNEPFFKKFGICPPPDPDFISREIQLVKRLDNRPVLITDSGELSWWHEAARAGDFFGTTMYRVVWNPRFGYFNYRYIIPPAFYRAKAWLNKLDNDKVIISELQAESWLPNNDKNISLDDQRRSMNQRQLRENLDLARRTGFTTAYLWGVEYWYWLDNQGDDSLLKAGQAIWSKR